MSLKERILRWAIEEFLIHDQWDRVIHIFVELYRKKYNEENNPTAYYSIQDQVAEATGHTQSIH